MAHRHTLRMEDQPPLDLMCWSLVRERKGSRLRLCSEMGAKPYRAFSAGPEKSESESHSVVSDSLRPHGLYSSRNSLVQHTGVSSLSLLQGIFPTQGLNPGLLHCRQILYQLSHKERMSCIQMTKERAEVLGWPKSSFRSFHCVLWKNPKEIFGQPNIFKKRVTV